MKTCGSCKDSACSGVGGNYGGCEDFTGEAIEEEPAEWQPTLEDYKELTVIYDKAQEEISRLLARLDGYENAVAELVRWAQGDEAP